ncbi:hypothetical protein Acr_12g0005700 [Actinidia rufa]|uniref:Ankyrin repeat family protein n=1 Tax=Actinidia rufa TaxID=165716 RepID=A0A7J0FIK1_9ERIC|nr:hypothetical protein Acr_12g0005700 [Actinidia rufa]
MDRLISMEPSNLVAIRIEQGQRCYGELTLRNVMYTMPVAFRLQPGNKARYTLPDSFPHCNDAFQLHSVVVPGAAVKDASSTFDSVPNDWFTAKKKQVFVDSGLKIMFVGAPILAQLVANGSMDEIREVLEKGDPDWKLADSVDPEGQTLLHLAIAQIRPDLVQLLLEFEPDVEAQSRSGSSPLEAAAAAGEALIAELLLAHKASTERSESSTWGPIHLASGGGHMEVLRLLLLKGASVDALTKDGNTALHLAVEERRRDCARLLLASGARADIKNSGDGDTPLHIASGLGDEHMNTDIIDFFDALRLGDSLCVAARKGETRIIHRLLENGAAINGRDQHGWTALHRAAFKGRTDVVRTLIEKGIDVDSRDEDGYTLPCTVLLSPVTPTSLNCWILIHGGATKDGLTQTNSHTHGLQFGNGMKAREKEVGEIKKKPNRRARSMRSSFDRSVPLAVV